MKRRVALRHAAREDLIESYLFIGCDSPDAAERFLQAAEESCDALADMPEIGHRWESEDQRLQDVRVWHVKGFENWLIFYRVTEHDVDILRVIHGARDIAAISGDELE